MLSRRVISGDGQRDHPGVGGWRLAGLHWWWLGIGAVRAIPYEDL
jgi:hypothetical protein